MGGPFVKGCTLEYSWGTKSDCRHDIAAADGHVGAGNEGRQVTGEEGDGVGDILVRTSVAEGDVIEVGLRRALEWAVLAEGPAGGHLVDSDAVLPNLACQHAKHAVHPALA